MMTKLNGIRVGCGLWILALAMVVAPGAIAQTSNGGANAEPTVKDGAPKTMPDMRLWSFGECDNRFPYVQSEEHKECVRVVGSPEARDARAYRVCETSNPRDPAEVNRCKSTYLENKERAAHNGMLPNTPAQPIAPPTAEDLKRVRAITAAAMEKKREEAAAAAATAEPAAAPAEPTPAPEDQESGTSSTLIIALLLAAGLLGGGAYMARRKQSEALGQ
jgi:hypothetical protein